MGDADGMKPFKFPAEGMQSKGREKGIGFEVSQRLGEGLFEFRVGSRNLDDTPIKMAGRPAAHTSGIETQFADQCLRRDTAHSPRFYIFQRAADS